MVKVIVAGFKGSMGNKSVHMVLDHKDFELVGAFDPTATESNLNEIPEFKDVDVPVYKNFDEIDTDAPDVWIDFTVPKAVYGNTKFALEHDIRPVIGTTGLTDDQIVELKKIAKEHNIGGLIAPNFGISAVLLMQFAQKAAQYFPNVEIIEMHHDHKLDAPSGTAIATAQKIAEVRKEHKQGNPDEKETLKGARGADYQGMRIHSVRLPGYVAHEQVLFGGPGEALTIRQDSFDRSSFMSGVAIAVAKVGGVNELLVGLENLL